MRDFQVAAEIARVAGSNPARFMAAVNRLRLIFESINQGASDVRFDVITEIE